MRRAWTGAPLLALAALQLTTGQARAQSSMLQTPVEVSIVTESQGPVYRQSADDLRLYTYDKDPPGQSTCIQACASAWPPVYAPPGAKPVGAWTTVGRPDGKRQWALKGKPVYTYAHDTPAEATGETVPGWRLLRYTP